MGATTLEKLQRSEAKDAAADQQRRAEAVARYRELVGELADGKESPEAVGVLAAVNRTAGQLAADVEQFRGRHQLLSVAKTAASAGAERAKAHERLNHFNGVEQPEALAKLKERRAELEEAARLSDKATKQSEEARRQLLEGADLELRARVKGLDHKKQQLRAEASELRCRAHKLELLAAQADGHRNSAPDRAEEFTKLAAGKRREADGWLAQAAAAEDAKGHPVLNLRSKANELEEEAQRLDALAKSQKHVAAGHAQRAAEKRREVSDLLGGAQEFDGPIAAVQNEIDDVLAEAIVPCPELGD